MNALSVQDQTGKFVLLPSPAVRIVSLVPSQTEFLAAIDLENEVVGITKFCVHPTDWFQRKNRVGGTKNVNIERVRLLQPDLVIAGKEENIKDQVDQIADFCPVYTSNVTCYDDALHMIVDIGILSGKSKEALKIKHTVQAAFEKVTINQFYTALYLIWREPWMAAGNDTFIHSMLERAGFLNVLHTEPRYPALTSEQIIALNPQVVLLSSEPYPFKEQHQEAVQALLPHAKVILANGELFSWYGSRMQFAPDYFLKLREQLHL